MSGTQASGTTAIFNIPPISSPRQTIRPGALKSNMRRGEYMTDDEIRYGVDAFDSFMTPIRDEYPQGEDRNKLSDTPQLFHRIFVNGVSVSDHCRQWTVGVRPDKQMEIMKCFVTSNAYSRDKIIEFIPPSPDPTRMPQIRLTTQMPEADLEKEQPPKPWFFRRWMESWGWVKPQQSPQQKYEQMLRSDDGVARAERSEMIKASLANAGIKEFTNEAIREQLERLRAESASEHTHNRQIGTQPVNTGQVITGHGDGIEVDVITLTGGHQNTAGAQRQPQRPVVSIDQQRLEALTGARALFEGIRYEMNMCFAVYGNITEEAMETNEFDYTNDINDLRTEGRFKRQFGQTGTSGMTVNSPPAVREFEERVDDCWKNVTNEQSRETENKLMLTMPKVNSIVASLDLEIGALNLRLNPPTQTRTGPGLRG